MSILFIDACVRENSGTLTIAREVMKDIKDEVTVVDLNLEDIKALASKFYGIEKTRAIRAMNLDAQMISAEELLTRATVS